MGALSGGRWSGRECFGRSYFDGAPASGGSPTARAGEIVAGPVSLGDVCVELGADVAGGLQFGIPVVVVSKQVSVGVFVVLAQVAWAVF